jgi:hypothetical protein
MEVPMPVKQSDDPQEQATYLTLISIFGALAGAFSLFARRQGEDARLAPLEFALLSLATYRAGRLVANDKVMEPIRAPFVAVPPGAQGRGARRAIGGLVTCSTCAGTWAAAFLLYGLRVAPIPTRAVLAILAATGTAEIAEKAVGALSMIGQAQRQGQSGSS